VIGIDVPPALLLIDLRHTIEQCDIRFQDGLIKSMRQFTTLCGEIGEAATRAQEDGWYMTAINDALASALKRTKEFMQRELTYIMPPGDQP